MKKMELTKAWPLVLCAVAVVFLLFAVSSGAAAPPSAGATVTQTAEDPTAAPGSVVVHPKLGGQILGYDIDQNGSEGLLSEYVSLGNGNNDVATETFDQKTGNIIKVVAQKKNTQDDYVAEGIVGSHVGLVLYQHVISLFHIKNHFLTMNPLDSNKFTGKWTPPIKKGYLLWTISHNPGTPNVAAYQVENGGNMNIYLFSSNVAANTFGPQIQFQSDNFIGNFPALAYDSKTNQAVLSGSIGCRTCTPEVATVDLKTGKTRKFTGVGLGTVNGLAVDPATGIAVTTTEIDFSVEFYDLAKGTGFTVTLPGATSQLQSGGDVEFDPIHKVFLVEQYTSTGNINDPQPHIYVYDEKGNVKNTVTGLQRIPISPVLIALHPSKRLGFLAVIVEPQHEFLELQSFTY